MAMVGPWAMTIKSAAREAMTMDGVGLSKAPIPEPAARLLLNQLLSPAFPTGGFAYSQGLEVAMVAGAVHDAGSLTDWIDGVLRHGSGRIDAILIARARLPDADLLTLADLAYAFAPSAERAMEMRDQGQSFVQVVRALGHDLPPLPNALAVGAVTATLPLQTPEILGLYLQALAAQLTSAAVRFLPLAASQGQAIIAHLAPLITQLAETCAEAPLSGLASATLGADHASMAHETLQPRIFRT